MKILLTTPHIQTGLGNAVIRQAELISSVGHDVTIITGTIQSIERQDNKKKYKIISMNLQGSNYFLDPIKGDIKAYHNLLTKPEWDIIIFNAWQNWCTDLGLRVFKQIKGKKYLYSHCISTNLFFKHRPIKSLIRYILLRPYWWSIKTKIRSFDGLIFLCKDGDDNRFDDLKIAKKSNASIFYIPNSISKNNSKLLKTPINSIKNRNQIISVGSYEWQKGFEFVIKSYAKSKIKNIIKLKIFGYKFNEYTKKLILLAKKLNINDEYIEFIENVSGSHLLKEYKKSYMFIFGSHTECQPLVLIDSNLTGTPFISKKSGAISSMMGGVTVSNTKEMAIYIDKIWVDKSYWKQLSLLGRKNALKKYHPDIIKSKLLNLLTKKYK